MEEKRFQYHPSKTSWNMERLFGKKRRFYVASYGLGQWIEQDRLFNEDTSTHRINAKHIAATETSYQHPASYLLGAILMAAPTAWTYETMAWFGAHYFFGFLAAVMLILYLVGRTVISVTYSGREMRYWEWGQREELIELIKETSKVADKAQIESRPQLEERETGESLDGSRTSN